MLTKIKTVSFEKENKEQPMVQNLAVEMIEELNQKLVEKSKSNNKLKQIALGFKKKLETYQENSNLLSKQIQFFKSEIQFLKEQISSQQNQKKVPTPEQSPPNQELLLQQT